MELHSIVDEDLTDLTDQELYTAVAQYLVHQEGIDVRLPGLPPKRDHKLWSHIVEGARGEIYDANAMVEAVASLLKKRRPSGASWWWNRVLASTAWGAQLRLFCRLSGLEVPYRQSSTVIGKEHGMADAIQLAGSSRHSQFIVLVSDVEELAETRPVLDALRLAKLRHHSIVAVAPFAPAFVAPPSNEHEQRVQNVFALRAEQQRRTVRQSVESLGIPVISATPHDMLGPLLRRLGRLRIARSGVA
jgi:hypothetical protein